MSSYVEGAMVAGEKLVHSGQLSLWAMWHLIALGVVLTPLFGLGLVFLAMAYVRYKSTELAVTTKRVIVKHGFIRRQTVEINLNMSKAFKSIRAYWVASSTLAHW